MYSFPRMVCRPYCTQTYALPSCGHRVQVLSRNVAYGLANLSGSGSMSEPMNAVSRQHFSPAAAADAVVLMYLLAPAPEFYPMHSLSTYVSAVHMMTHCTSHPGGVHRASIILYASRPQTALQVAGSRHICLRPCRTSTHVLST